MTYCSLRVAFEGVQGHNLQDRLPELPEKMLNSGRGRGVQSKSELSKLQVLGNVKGGNTCLRK